MDEETVNPQEELIEQPVAEEVQEEQEKPEEQEDKGKVPLSALQKERRKRQEAELELKWYKENQGRKAEPDPAPEEDKYETPTREDLGKLKRETIREIQETNWIKENPERFERVNEQLAEFLKRRPNLASAIEAAPNRYAEAWELMDKLSPKEQAKLKAAAPKNTAPGNPASIPKGAAMSQAVDVMSMNDDEFAAWRKSQRRNR